MLHEAQSFTFSALSPLKEYTDFRKLPDTQFEDLLALTRLSDAQKSDLRKTNKTDRQAYFSNAMAWIELSDANEKSSIFNNYLIENRIFMTDELRTKCGAINECISKALSYYDSAMTDQNDAYTINTAREQLANLKPKIDDVEQAIQKRLHYEEA
jgi:hypothetical protein